MHLKLLQIRLKVAHPTFQPFFFTGIPSYKVQEDTPPQHARARNIAAGAAEGGAEKNAIRKASPGEGEGGHGLV
jgi:hypothetical protein